MSAEVLRQAARLMRERAEAASPGPWDVEGQGPGGVNMGCGVVWTKAEQIFGGDIAMPAGDMYPRSGYSPMEDMTHIASWHPAVALAVADCLDAAANVWPPDPHEPREGCPDCTWLAVAHAYLGTAS